MLLLAASVRLYSVLLVLYPEAFRRRYSEEMRRDFRELMREGLEEGGAKELVRVLAQAHSDLVLTALKERGTTAAGRYASYLFVDLRIAQRAAARAMVAVVLVAVGVSWASILQTPTYEASAQVWVEEGSPAQGTGNGKIQLIPNAPAGETLRALTQTTMMAIDSRPVAQEAIQRLGLRMEPAEQLDNLTVEHIEDTSFIVLTYQDTDPERAKQIANTVGQVSSEFISERTVGRQLTVTLQDKAIFPESPASPHPLRNGLLTLVVGLMLCGVLLPAVPGVAANVAGQLGGQAVRQGVGQAGVPAVPPGDPSEADVIKEKELLEALDRRGKLTAMEAALESSLSVEEAERILSELAVRGHLEVTVEHGRLHYALWDRDAPL